MMRTVLFVLALANWGLVAHVAGQDQCSDTLKSIKLNSAWQEYETNTEDSNEDAVASLVNCLHSDSGCDNKKITLDKGLAAQRKKCISDVPNTKFHRTNTVMC